MGGEAPAVGRVPSVRGGSFESMAAASDGLPWRTATSFSQVGGLHQQGSVSSSAAARMASSTCLACYSAAAAC